MPESLSFFVDCLDRLRNYPTNRFDIAPVDPPYGIGESSANHTSRNTPVRQKNGAILKAPTNKYKRTDWDSMPPADEYFEQLFRVSKNQIIWGANYFSQIVGITFKPPRRQEWPDFIKQYPTGWILWDKVNGGNDFNDCELAWTSFKEPSYIIPYMWNGMMQGKSLHEPYTQQGDKSLNEKRIHPTQKPVIIYRYLYNRYCFSGQWALDTHLGSGSNRIAAHDMGVNFEGMENNRHIFDLQERRWVEYFLQSNKLF